MNKAVDKYIELSLLQKAATENGDYKVTNKAEKNRFKIVDNLTKTDSLEKLIPLLKHNEPNVRLWAAYDLLESSLCYEECLKVLREIYTSEKGIVGLGAEMTLKRLGEL